MPTVWRILRTRSGEEISAGWVEYRGEARVSQPWRRTRPRIEPAPKWMGATAGAEVLPVCGHCASPQVWRGRWVCESCISHGLAEAYDVPVRMPRSLPREALVGVGLHSEASLPQPATRTGVAACDGADGPSTSADTTSPPQQNGRRASGEDACESTSAGARVPGAAVSILRSQNGNNSTGRSERVAWLDKVEALTSFHRAAIAARCVMRGTRTSELGPYVTHRAQQLARGQAERFANVRKCGEAAYSAVMEDGSEHVIQSHCDCWRVCNRCLQKRKYKLTQGLERSRERAITEFRRESKRVYSGPEGRYSDKLFTFTVPHGESVAEDARLLPKLWAPVLRKLRAHLKERGVRRNLPWCRAIEIAPGDTGGHAHLHVWFYGPFVDIVLLRAWWGDELQKVGRTVPQRTREQALSGGRDKRLGSWLRRGDMVPWPVVDVRAGGEASAAYTQKVGVQLYIAKGVEISRLEPAHAAAIYEALEGVRQTQWARGWAPQRYRGPVRMVRLRRLTSEEKQAESDRILGRDKAAPEAVLRL